jgi:hypothetical protein
MKISRGNKSPSEKNVNDPLGLTEDSRSVRGVFMSNNNSNVLIPKSTTTKMVMANEAVFTFSKIRLVHQNLLEFAPMIEDLSLQSGDILAATKHWKKGTSIMNLIQKLQKHYCKRSKDLMSIMKRNAQKVKEQTKVSLKMAKSSGKQNPHEEERLELPRGRQPFQNQAWVKNAADKLNDRFVDPR